MLKSLLTLSLQVQQKQEMMAIEEARAVTNADALFRRGLEALIGDHLSACMEAAAGETFGRRFRFQGEGSASGLGGVDDEETGFQDDERGQACESDGSVGARRSEQSTIGTEGDVQADSDHNERFDVETSLEPGSSGSGREVLDGIRERFEVISNEEEGETRGLLKRQRPRGSHNVDTVSQDPELVALARMQAVSSMLDASFLRVLLRHPV